MSSKKVHLCVAAASLGDKILNNRENGITGITRQTEARQQKAIAANCTARSIFSFSSLSQQF